MTKTHKQRRPPKREWFWIDNAIVDKYAAEVGTSAIDVYFVLCRFADGNGESFPSVKRIGDLLNLHPDTVRTAIKKLKKAGLIDVERRRLGGLNKSNLYRVIPLDSARNGRVPETTVHERIGHHTRPEPVRVPEQTVGEEDLVEEDILNKKGSNQKKKEDYDWFFGIQSEQRQERSSVASEYERNDLDLVEASSNRGEDGS